MELAGSVELAESALDIAGSIGTALSSGKFAPYPEAPLQIANKPLDLTLCLRPIRRAQALHKTRMASIIKEGRVRSGGLRSLIPFDCDHAFR